MAAAARHADAEALHWMAYHAAKGKEVFYFAQSQRGGPAMMVLGDMMVPDRDDDCPFAEPKVHGAEHEETPVE